jgi:transcriptional regulator with XRE-family HTH domain
MRSISEKEFGSVQGRMPRKPSALAETLMGYVAANVRRRRVKLGLTQDELAEAAHVDSTYITRVERAKVNVTIGVLAQLAVALRCRPADLLRVAKMHEIIQGRPTRRRPKSYSS